MKPADMALVRRVIKYTAYVAVAILVSLVLFLISTTFSEPWWRNDNAPLPEEWSAMWGLFGTLAAVGAAGIALVTLFVAWRQLTAALDQFERTQAQAKRESEDRNRPYVTVEVVPSIAGASTWDIVIRNTGGSIAENVRVHLAKGKVSDGADLPLAGVKIEAFLAKPFTLVPGGSLRVYWHFDTPHFDLDNGAPAAGSIRATYEWHREDAIQDLEITYNYDLDVFGPIAPVPDDGPVESGSGTRDQYQLRNIEHALRAVARNLGALGR